MLSELAHVAAYAASGSFGRDMYRKLKKGDLLVFFLAGTFLTVVGFRLLADPRDRGPVARIFVALGSIAMIVIGTGLVGLVLAVITGGSSAFIVVAFVYLVVAGGAGLFWGRRDHAKRERARAIERHNLEFLEREGFRDLGVGEDIIEDRDGNRLKYKDEEPSRMIFMVVGRRNVRAAISLDPEGRMLSYTGAVRL